MMENGIEPLYPSMARHSNLTYSVKIFADANKFRSITDMTTDTTTTVINGRKEENVLIAIIPMMLRLKMLHINIK